LNCELDHLSDVLKKIVSFSRFYLKFVSSLNKVVSAGDSESSGSLFEVDAGRSGLQLGRMISDGSESRI